MMMNQTNMIHFLVSETVLCFLFASTIKSMLYMIPFKVYTDIKNYYTNINISIYTFYIMFTP